MVVCPNCQYENMREGKYCSNCGRSLSPEQSPPPPPQPPYGQQVPYYQPYYPYLGFQMKNPGIAAILAFVVGILGLMGVGHLYVGKITRGFIIMVAGIALWLATVFGLFIGLAFFGLGLWFLGIIGLVAILILLVWQTYDAYNQANLYNDFYRQSGRPPW